MSSPINSPAPTSSPHRLSSLVKIPSWYRLVFAHSIQTAWRRSAMIAMTVGASNASRPRASMTEETAATTDAAATRRTKTRDPSEPSAGRLTCHTSTATMTLPTAERASLTLP
ncbi:hypothetical protein E3T54_11015 [Cryobacterium sp. Sr8]|nr:hypothetical protein E3T54_11015 [Cryobacterium sp. Sr8]